ncbi:hypothetical protein NESM_000781100 [Novymonas esmeraldas]|uniref:C3H1-type domain-containing protein n=1 Tax=Novymonas esmeraldas TaxID=1808958 RepID=A0AAW0EXE3_9TRYP
MSFSVHAKAFVPSSAAFTPSATREAAAAAETTDAKDCVCVAFYENGKCPYGADCEHAHGFSELSSVTQMKLLGSVPVESIPSHFFGTSSTRDDVRFAVDAALPRTSVTYSRFGPGQGDEAERTVSARRRPPGKDRPLVVSHIGPQPPMLDAGSLSSRTSSSAESLHAVGAIQPSKSATSLAVAVPAGAANTGAFKMHLPLRCRYPHSTIPGTYYDVLALPRDAGHGDIIAKYRAWQKDGFKRMRLVDPVGAEAVDRVIVEARNVLGNPSLRAAYDQQLPLPPSKQPTSLSTASCGGAGLTSASTTPSKYRVQGHSSAASSGSEAHHKPGDSHHRPDCSRSSSTAYHIDRTAPVVTISSLRDGESIW